MKKLIVSLFTLLALGGGSVSASAQQAKPGDPVAGQKKVDMCIGCHGIPSYKASFPEIYQVPKISGQSPEYIVSSLVAYKKGDRKHPSMRSIAVTLTDQDMADVAAFYAQNGKAPGDVAPPETPPAPPADVAALLQKGNCASCHGSNLSKPIAGYPKLAGQHADYLYVALKAYQTTGTDRIGRNNAIMAGMAKLYTPAELKKLSVYIASLPGELKTVEEPHFRFLP